MSYMPELIQLPAHGGIHADVDYSALMMSAEEENRKDAHIHSFCEVYFNISGDVAFWVENRVYPVKPGDIIITRPNEFHRCIYRSDCVHEHYCLWIMSDGQASPLLSAFFDRRSGEGNLISLSTRQREAFTEYLETYARYRRSGKVDAAASLWAIFGILGLLNNSKASDVPAEHMPNELSRIVKYIDASYNTDCSVKKLVSDFYISRRTLNRQFRDYLGTTPSKYVETRRLAAARILLEKGETVQVACQHCGFPDYSHFIALFRKRFGITPYQYRKKHYACTP